MGRYKKLTRKKDKSRDIITAPATTAMDWFRENMERILAAAGAVAVITAAVYGFIYYRNARIEAAYTRLYEATASAGGENATKEKIAQSARALEEFIGQGGPDEVMALARLKLGEALLKNGDYARAAQAYGEASRSAEKGTLIHELAIAGEADALWKGGEPSKAALKLAGLADSAKSYPRADALYNLAFAHAAAGEKDEATKAINRLRSEYPSFQSSEELEDTIGRIESGELSRPLAAAGAATEKQPLEKPVSAADIHGAE